MAEQSQVLMDWLYQGRSVSIVILTKIGIDVHVHSFDPFDPALKLGAHRIWDESAAVAVSASKVRFFVVLKICFLGVSFLCSSAILLARFGF